MGSEASPTLSLFQCFRAFTFRLNNQAKQQCCHQLEAEQHRCPHTH